MATSRSILHSPLSKTLKSLLPKHPFSTTPNTHEFTSPNNYLNSWKTPTNPKEAQSQLALLRRDYAKKVKEVRKVYIQEMELQKIEKKRKDDAKQQALKIANEERKLVKAAVKKVKAAEREVALEEFRQTLVKERAEKLEYWKKREKAVQEMKEKKNELIRRQSSIWVDEKDLEKKTLEAIVNIVSI